MAAAIGKNVRDMEMPLKSLLLAAVMAMPTTAAAQFAGDVVTGRLMLGWRMENGHHMAALRLRLDPGWKTYWRVPGDAGIPPRFDWSGSDNVGAVTVHWPVPRIFDQNGMRSVGYAGEVVMPVEIVPARPGEPIALQGRIDIGVCQDVCMPVALAVNASLPSEGVAAGSGDIRAALANRPMSAGEAGVGNVTCGVEPISDGMRVTVRVDVPPMGADEAAVVEFADPTVWISEAETAREDGALVAMADLVPAEAAPFSLSRQDLRFTVLGEGRAVDIRGCISGE